MTARNTATLAIAAEQREAHGEPISSRVRSIERYGDASAVVH